MPKFTEEIKTTENPSVYWKARRFLVLHCNWCRPHHLENASRPVRPDRYKDHRRNFRKGTKRG